jgi:phosphohistidine phosphatase SixA
MAEQLARTLRSLSAGSLFLPARFTIIVTSSYAPAKEMAELLWRTPQARVRELDCLTPFAPGGDDFSTFFEDLEKSAGPVCDSDAIAVVGHEPRVSRLLSFLTSRAPRSLERGEAVWLKAPLNDFRMGKGVLRRSTLKTDHSESLREKVRSKMQVCTFLAGFSSTALVQILRESEKMLEIQRIVAAASFVAAFSLFAGAIYIYDELSMPRQFWENAPREPDAFSEGQFGFDWLMNGPVYANMVRTWRLFFTPALFCTLVGVFALLSARLNEAKGWLVWAACAAALMLASFVYRRFRPKLAID